MLRRCRPSWLVARPTTAKNALKFWRLAMQLYFCIGAWRMLCPRYRRAFLDLIMTLRDTLLLGRGSRSCMLRCCRTPQVLKRAVEARAVPVRRSYEATKYERRHSSLPLPSPRTIRRADFCHACDAAQALLSALRRVGAGGAALGACVCCPQTLASWRVRATGSSFFQGAAFVTRPRPCQGFLRRWRASPRAAFWRDGRTYRERTIPSSLCSRLCGQPSCNVAASRCNLLVSVVIMMHGWQHTCLEAGRRPTRYATGITSLQLALPTVEAGRATEPTMSPHLQVCLRAPPRTSA